MWRPSPRNRGAPVDGTTPPRSTRRGAASCVTTSHCSAAARGQLVRMWLLKCSLACCVPSHPGGLWHFGHCPVSSEFDRLGPSSFAASAPAIIDECGRKCPPAVAPCLVCVCALASGLRWAWWGGGGLRSAGGGLTGARLSMCATVAAGRQARARARARACVGLRCGGRAATPPPAVPPYSVAGGGAAERSGARHRPQRHAPPPCRIYGRESAAAPRSLPAS